VRIAISCDENPGDTGSVAADGTAERDVNVRVCGPLQAALQRCGQDAWFDPSITYFERVARANADGTALLIACAHDVSTPGVRGGCAVFCPGGQSWGKQAQLADAIFAQLLAGGLTVRRRPDAVESIWECCSFGGDTAYIELNAMSPDDEPIWSAPDYGARAAEAICRAVASVEGFAYVPPGGLLAMLSDQDQQQVHDEVHALWGWVTQNGDPLLRDLQARATGLQGALTAVKTELDHVQAAGVNVDFSQVTSALTAIETAQAALDAHQQGLAKHLGVGTP
jgi:hypothetical protein